MKPVTTAHTAASGSARTVRLPVLADPVGLGQARLRRRRRFRAAVLAGVWLLMIAHVTHWAVTGRSVAPFVLSDAMKTLELGQVNPGFLLFAAALLVTLVCGRFLCGWACHMGALQDLCAWMLGKAGVRPRMFRARLLGYVPLFLAVYMFIWPTAKRVALLPALERLWPAGAAYLGPVQPFPGWSTKFMTTELWSGLPSAAVAIPFLLLCGFATVYFLGARGLCRYGCPYGGFFLPVEQIAVGRVVVNADLCDGCGRCTAACTAGVRVLEETRAYGMVVDRNCMRSLDCVAACPQEALRLGVARPAIMKNASAGADLPPKVRYDLSTRAELAILAVFVLGLAATRGLYGVIPLLMSVTISVLSAFVLWRAWTLPTTRDARFVGVELKRAGRWRPGGIAFVALAAAVGVLLAHSAAVRSAQCWGGVLDGRVSTTREQAFGVDPSGVRDEDRATARRALWWYTVAAPVGAGGVALLPTPQTEPRMAWLALVAGEYRRAEQLLRCAAGRFPDNDTLTGELARVILLRDDVRSALETLRAACADNRPRGESRRLLGWLLLNTGDPAGAAAQFERVMRDGGNDPQTLELLHIAQEMAAESARK
ncbi:MAG: 4Fe-4S binding protein [Phycisphaeraceae bacterium]|nr:4Fe-4S binding protein [Phycisphaeraceae bacterium]